MLVVALFLPMPFAGSLVAIGAATFLLLMSVSFLKNNNPMAVLIAMSAAMPLVLLAVVSFVVSGYSLRAFLGNGFEWGTLGSFFLLALSLGVGVYGARTLGRILMPSLVLCVVFLGTYISMSWMGMIQAIELTSVVSFAVALTTFVSALYSDYSVIIWKSVLYAVASVVSFVIFVLLFSREAALASLCASLLVVGYAWRNRALSGRSILPLTSIFAILLVGLLSFGFLKSIVPISDETRPSIINNTQVIGIAYDSSFAITFVGIGPNSFPFAWNRYRAETFNKSNFWNFTPQRSYSSLIQLPLETGLLGVLFFALLFINVLKRPMYVKQPTNLVDTDLVGSASLLGVAVFCLAAAALYPVGTAYLFLAGVAFAAYSIRRYSLGECIQSLSVSRRILGIAIAVLLVCVGVYVAQIAGRQIIAAYNHSQGVALATSGDYDKAVKYLSKAAKAWSSAEYNHDASVAYVSKANALLKNNGGFSTTGVIQYDFSRAQELAGYAIAAESKDFEAWLYRANLNIQLAQAGIEGSLDSIWAPYEKNVPKGVEEKTAREAIVVMKQLSPSRPDPYYLDARLSMIHSDYIGARALLERALELKPNYMEALEALKSLPL